MGATAAASSSVHPAVELKPLPSGANRRATRAADEPESETQAQEDIEAQPLIARENKQTNYCLKYRHVSNFIPEYIGHVFDFIQLFTVFWAAGHGWDWPYWFMRDWQWITVFSIDGIRQHVDLGGKAVVSISLNYYGWMVLWLAMPAALAGVYLGLMRTLAGPHSKGLVWASWINRVFCCILELLYLPWAFTVGTVYFCTKTGNNTLTTDSSVLCWSGPHSFMLVLVTVFGTVYLLGFPLLLYREIRKRLVFDDPRAYNKFIKQREFDWMVGLESSWSFMHIYLVSSYKRRWVYYKSLNLLHKLLMVFWYHMLYDSPKTQNLMMFITLLVPTVIQLFRQPFRKISSNVVHQFARWVLIVMLFMAQMVLQQVRSPLLVASVHYVWLWFFTVVAYVAIFGTAGLQIFTRKTWATTPHLIKKITDISGHYIDSIFAAREVHARLQYKYVLFADPSALADQISIVDENRREARKEGLMVESSLESVLEDLVVLYNHIHEYSLLPFPPLENVLPQFRARLDTRDYEMMLTAPTKRRILLKLLCVMTWFNGRKIKKLPGGVEHWPSRDTEEEEGTAWDYTAAEEREEEAKKARVLKEVFEEEEKDEMEDVNSYLNNLGVRSSVSARAPGQQRRAAFFGGGGSAQRNGFRASRLEDIAEEEEEGMQSPRAPAASPDIPDMSILDLAAQRRRPMLGSQLEDSLSRLDQLVLAEESESAPALSRISEEKPKERRLPPAPVPPPAAIHDDNVEAVDIDDDKPASDPSVPAGLPPLVKEDEEDKPSAPVEDARKDDSPADDVESREAALQQERHDLRTAIKKYEADFEARTGHQPTHKDKRADQTLYNMYMDKKRVTKELEALEKEKAESKSSGRSSKPAPPPPAAEPVDTTPTPPVESEPAPLPGSVAEPVDEGNETPAAAPPTLDAPPTLSAAPTEPADTPAGEATDEASVTIVAKPVPSTPDDLLPFTKELLSYVAEEDSVTETRAEVTAKLHETRVLWKKQIRKWDKDFQAANGTAPTNKDKQEIKPWYLMEKKLKAAHAKWSG